MHFEKMDTSPTEYVVLDVETNGLRSKEDDLLSISIYRPDNGDTYDRFLPLELNSAVYTTGINGIRMWDLKGKESLSQHEVDTLFERFELGRRIILHYGPLDELFLREYFRRHGLSGFEAMSFFNFKKLICASKFSDGSLSKDSLCEAFGIEGVTDVHSGHNDCVLEWKLFEAIGGTPLLATRGDLCYNLFTLEPDYIIPVSYLGSYPNLDKLVVRPYIEASGEKVRSFRIDGEGIRRFPTNFSGMTIENLIGSMLGAREVDSSSFLMENKRKLKYVGSIRPYGDVVPMSFNSDGTVTAAREKDKALEAELNAVILRLKERIRPVVDFIRSEILVNDEILFQELSLDDERGILALCDLSDQEAILEIKTSSADVQRYKEQLFYEGRGRKTYLMGMSWHRVDPTDPFGELDYVEFEIVRVKCCIGEKPDLRAEAGRKRSETARKKWEQRLAGSGVTIIGYEGSTKPMKLKCETCGCEWSIRAQALKEKGPICPGCNPEAVTKRGRPTGTKQSPTEARASMKTNGLKYAEKVRTNSTGKILVDPDDYRGSREPIRAKCLTCGHEWTSRADHLLARCWCPECRRMHR